MDLLHNKRVVLQDPCKNLNAVHGLQIASLVSYDDDVSKVPLGITEMNTAMHHPRPATLHLLR